MHHVITILSMKLAFFPMIYFCLGCSLCLLCLHMLFCSLYVLIYACSFYVRYLHYFTVLYIYTGMDVAFPSRLFSGISSNVYFKEQ